MNEPTEKITINLGVVDIGKIELLVENGFYSNRTDFIKSAVRRALDSHDLTVNRAIESKHYVAGITTFNRAYLEKARDKGQRLDVRIIGLASFAADVTPELVRESVGSFKVYGVVRATQEIKDVLKPLEPV